MYALPVHRCQRKKKLNCTVVTEGGNPQLKHHRHHITVYVLATKGSLSSKRTNSSVHTFTQTHGQVDMVVHGGCWNAMWGVNLSRPSLTGFWVVLCIGL